MQLRLSVGSSDGSGIAVLEGYERLEVVGESFRQDNLWSLVGGRGDPRQYVRTKIIAVLTAEPDNPYDANAVAVRINGLHVGYLSRQDASQYQPGLLALQRRLGKPVANAGVIAGGGIREDGPGKLGVFLDFNPEDFGGQPPQEPPAREWTTRTGLSEIVGATAPASSDELARLSSLPRTDVSAIPALRQLLAQETDPIRRHFIYAAIESRLYRCRDIFSSALDEFDLSCRQHDGEMDGICHAFMAELGSIPLLELYHQMAIRQQKIGDYRAALRWAERGIALYSGRAGRRAAIEDLRRRAATYRAKLVTRPV